jgi:hypothetical protein
MSFVRRGQPIRADELLTRTRHIRRSALSALLAAVLLATSSGLLATAAPADASRDMQSMFEVPQIEGRGNPMPMLRTLRYLGVDIVRLGVAWSSFAPHPRSRARPSFDASDPHTYNWRWLDRIVGDANRLGLGVDLVVGGFAPLWASSPVGRPVVARQVGTPWEPNASEYGQFVQAVAAHYPSVHFWELWNEPNWGPALEPQYLHSSVPVSAAYYRPLVEAGWSALLSTGHASDTISIGNLSQDGSAPPVGEFRTTAPLTFMRTLYCLNRWYKPLMGSAAREANCPGSKEAFATANPALFQVSGVGIHPYPFGNPPSQKVSLSPNDAEVADIPDVIRAVDRMQTAYGSHRRMAIYNTEYGYATRPNETSSNFASPGAAARYINQAEFISWRNRRVTTYAQYELADSGWFRTGLFWKPHTVASPGPLFRPKPSFYAYRLPVWLPVTRARRGRPLEVWGEVRAARYARMDTGRAQHVQIQFAPRGSTHYRTLRTVRLTSADGYFDVHVRFPASGSVRLTWTYPAGDPRLRDALRAFFWRAASHRRIFSRTTRITLN